MMIGLLLAGLSFGVVIHLLDRPSVPAWQAKYAYRLVAWVCWLGWVATAFKALSWHTELVQIYRYCR